MRPLSPGATPGFFGNCLVNTPGVAIPAQGISQLSSLVLTGQAVNGGSDVVFLRTSPTTLFSATAPDSILSLANGWNIAEFNVLGDGSGSPNAIFNSGARVTVRTTMTNGTRTSPTCVTGGSTAETNSLNLVPSSGCPRSGTTPMFEFIQSTAGTANVPFCLLNDFTPIQAALD